MRFTGALRRYQRRVERGDVPAVCRTRFGNLTKRCVDCGGPVSITSVARCWECYQAKPKPRKPAAERFWAFVDKSGDCWLWKAAKDQAGYGLFTLEPGVSRRAHRVAYEMEVGPIPDGLEIDHLCRVRACVRPLHLEAVTRLENIRRVPWPNSAKTHCRNGHPFAGENLVRVGNERRCRTCTNANKRAMRERRKSVAA